MTTDARVRSTPHSLKVAGVRVAVVRKDIKNLHLGVYPPDGRVRVAAPLAVSDAAVRVAVVGKLRWIARQRAAFAKQLREPTHTMVTGESHQVFGVRYRLAVIADGTLARPVVRLKGRRTMELRAPAATDAATRLFALRRWYRAQLCAVVPALLAAWEERLGVAVAGWGIRRMKTKWGSCNPEARRVWLNLELAKKPHACLEYVIVHELVHLLAPHHDERFQALMDRWMPTWRQRKSRLNAAPLASETWTF